jgi:hypothetical protein
LSVLAVLIVASVPAAASAHSQNRWYWSTEYAEHRIEVKNADIQAEAFCFGVGKPYKKRLHRHHDCDVFWWDDEADDWTTDGARLHVIAKKKYILDWD